MTNATRTILSLFLALGIACTRQAPDADRGVAPRPQPKLQGDVSVELSSVTLGDDCGVSWTPPPPASPPPAKRAAPSTPAAVAPAESCALGADCGGYEGRACRQTSMQLALHATGTTSPTPVRIKKVELLDANGGFLAELSPRNPTRWSDAGSYQPWDQTIAPDEHAAVSFVLGSPAWHAMEGGEYAQANKTFQVRVTVLVGVKDRVLEKKAIQPTFMPPPVPT